MNINTVYARLARQVCRMPKICGMLICFFIIISLSGCDRQGHDDDYDAARAAMLHHDYARAERLFERYLQEEKHSGKRWSAWQYLFEVLDKSDSGKRWAEIYLETMLDEYASDPARMRQILYRSASLREAGLDFTKAAEDLQRILKMPDVDPMEYASTARHLAYLQLRQRNLDGAEETLLGCLGQHIDNDIRSECLYDLAHVTSLSGRNNLGRNFLDQILDMEDAAPAVKVMAEFMRADMLEQEGKLSDALKAFEAIRDVYPNPPVVTVRIVYLQNKINGRR